LSKRRAKQSSFPDRESEQSVGEDDAYLRRLGDAWMRKLFPNFGVRPTPGGVFIVPAGGVARLRYATALDGLEFHNYEQAVEINILRRATLAAPGSVFS